MKNKIISIIGARPQFIKYAPLSNELRKNYKEILIHTGQHYDQKMSDIFFDQLDIPNPDYNLGIGSGSHGYQTGNMLIEIEKILKKEKPGLVLVYGDTNSTIAGALAASKLQIKIAHIEAGLRSFDRDMPEEINRLITDHISNILFCPTKTAVNNLENEGISNGTYLVGDVMVDSLEQNRKVAEITSKIVETIGVIKGNYLVVTIHRANNTDNKENLYSIIKALEELDKIIIFPVHPRTAKSIHKYGLKIPPNIKMVEPLGYIDMIALMIGAEKIITDSGGIQKEAYILRRPCITLRNNTEWVETLEGGWNILVGADKKKILDAAILEPGELQKEIFGNIGSCKRIVNILNGYMKIKD